MYRAIGERVASARRGHRPPLTQEDLAERSGGVLSRSAVANIETGRQRVSLFQLYELAAALDVSPEELLAPAEVLPKRAKEALCGSDPKERTFLDRVLTGAERQNVLGTKGGANGHEDTT